MSRFGPYVLSGPKISVYSEDRYISIFQALLILAAWVRDIDYLLKTRRIRLSNVSRLLKSARSGEEK